MLRTVLINCNKVSRRCDKSKRTLLRNLNDSSNYHTVCCIEKIDNKKRPNHRRIAQKCFSTKIIKSPFPPVSIPNEDFVSYVWRNHEEVEDQAVATCAVSGRNYTYGMMRMLIDKCAKTLIGHCKLQPGEVVGLLLPNLPEFMIVSHGILAAGLKATFVNPLYTADEIAQQFENASVKAIVTIPLFLDTVLEISKKLPGYRTTICAGGANDAIKNVHDLQSLLMEGDTAELPKVDPNEVAILPYSSGTTGLPKGVRLTHKNLIANLAQENVDNICKLIPEEKNQKSLTVLPMFHIYGFNAIMNSSVVLGLHLVTMPRFTPEDYVKALIEHKPYSLFVVPSLLLFLASHPSVKKEHLLSIETITSGAAPATEGVLQKFREKVGKDVFFRQGYGMTESSPVITFTPRDTPISKKETVGVLLPNTEAVVISLTTGEPLGPHKPGELFVKGPQVMAGYLNNDKATQETMTGDGWLRTGDVVSYDEDGFFFIVDRCKELIKVKGNQVSPTELENLILSIPGVADVAVVGVPDDLAGEIPRAFIVLQPGVKLTDKDVQEFVTPKVANYKKLAGGSHFIGAIPRNPSGKILRNQLKILQT